MGLLDYFRKNQALELNQPSEPVAESATLKPQNQVLALSDDREDGYVQVDFRKLSYAEVAALKGAGNVGGAASVAGSSGLSPALSPVIDVNRDLGTEITDYQLAAALQRQINSRQVKNYVMEGDSVDALDQYDYVVNKGCRIAKKINV